MQAYTVYHTHTCISESMGRHNEHSIIVTLNCIQMYITTVHC